MADKTPDERYMREALRLASRGYPAPNPHVGCVLVRDGDVVGRGFHAYAGGPHAEVVALQDAGPRARGATAYVTLEPCNHTGRTGPCSEALLEAGVRRVVVAVRDPSRVAAGGLDRLVAAGVEVIDGVLEAESRAVLAQFLFASSTGRPFVVAKAAMTLDGRIALPNGESQWITGPAARRAAHRLRVELGAVLVGRRTVEMDNPRLTARLPRVVNQPLRVVLDPSGALGAGYEVFSNEAPSLHLTQEQVAVGPDGFDLHGVLDAIHQRGATGLLVEGGGDTIAKFIRARLVDRLDLFVAPRLLGAGTSWVGSLGVEHLRDAPEWAFQRVRHVGTDLLVSALPII